ncbi:hypothetical protein EOD42_03055 [Rhodovarius crocodyli]|uniref:Uncharacterized protein n=1 Tax=Rhodovarius crocodyli TaxID=1979269 RepID=A0A437MNB0_9PROT|nr:hypothetical protein [Rhodovarius crocodyli]RVT99100.1 hypothetical protein EOD42_03055 [Rhodovarius crocodyli]
MKLSKLATPVAAAADGLWTGPWPETGDLKIKARPYTEDYQTALSRAQNELVRRLRVEGALKNREGWEDIALKDRLALSRELLLKRLVVDVDGLEEDDDTPVTVERFRELAMDADTYGALVTAAFLAVDQVTSDKDLLRKAAEGNSVRSSGSTSAPAKPS